MTKARVLLVEPDYPNKYPPLGLMKLASYHRVRNGGDEVYFVKGPHASALKSAWDRVYVTTLFSFEWKRTAKAIDFAIQAAGGQAERVFVGGIAASLMRDEFVREPKWAGVRFIGGLLDQAPAVSLSLSKDLCEFGWDDVTGTPIENLVPDYSILDQIDYQYPVHDAYFGYASRGCVRKCAFCGVPKLEGAMREMPPLRELVEGIAQEYGEKRDLVLMDNNVSASARYQEIIAEIRDLGFHRGATMSVESSGRSVKRRVDFNQGVDARILAKSPMYLKELASICISPLRIAFDHIGVRKVYERAIRMAADNEITSLSNYMLYNFMDTPQDLYERMMLNIQLNEELGIRIWSFPMRYQPITLKDRSHVGKKWNRYYLRSFQIMLQATRGVVSGNPEFFLRAYGQDQDGFLELLSLPHAFIFHREHYEHGAGKGVREEYTAKKAGLQEGQQCELLDLLSAPAGGGETRKQRILRLSSDASIDKSIRDVLYYHTLGTRPDDKIEDHQMIPTALRGSNEDSYPDDQERVEDAGLFDHEHVIGDGTASNAPLV